MSGRGWPCAIGRVDRASQWLMVRGRPVQQAGTSLFEAVLNLLEIVIESGAGSGNFHLRPTFRVGLLGRGVA